MVLLKAATYLMTVGQRGVKLYKQSKAPKRVPRPSSRSIELGGWVSEHYLHQMP